jgi:hypothetical protein
MRNVGKISMAGIALLRAVLATAFLLMSALQPGLFAAANAKGFHSDAGITLSAHKPVQDVRPHVHDHDVEADATDASSKSHHGGAKKSDGKSCEVHCAPAQAVPVEWPVLGNTLVRCFAAATAAVMSLCEYAELVRPPRHLS